MTKKYASLLRWRKAHPEKNRAIRKRYYRKNAETIKAKSRAWYWKNHERAKHNARTGVLRIKYGLSRAQYEALIKKQKGRCAICATRFKTTQDRHTDHSHASGKARSLLCTKCNNGLGHVEKDAHLQHLALEPVESDLSGLR